MAIATVTELKMLIGGEWVEAANYAPDLNPLDQGVWQHLKHVELANVCCTVLRHLRGRPEPGSSEA